MLEISHVSKNFGRVRVLHDVTFDVKDGSSCLLIGSNGAGKTTLIKSIVGLLNFSGEIRVDGLDARSDGKRARERIGYVPQAFNFYDKLAVEEEANLMARLKGLSAASTKGSLQLMGLWDARRRRVGELSHGMRQRLAVALGLINDPPLLIFDEPLSSIDLKGRLDFESMMRRLAKMGKTLLISTHLPGLSGSVEQTVVIDSGRVVAGGSPRDLLAGLGSKDKVYLKLPNSAKDQAKQALEDLKFDVKTEGEWLLISADPALKSQIIDAMTERGFEIQDIIIEPSTIESEYVNLIGDRGRDV